MSGRRWLLAWVLMLPACLEWDALRGPMRPGGDAGGGGTGGGNDAGLDEPVPIVRWSFSRAGTVARVEDGAPRAPEVPLGPDPENPGGATAAGGWLRLNGNEFSATAPAGQALANALNQSPAGMSLEVWVEPGDAAGMDSFVAVLGLALRQTDGGFVAEFTSEGIVRDLGPEPGGPAPVHLVVTITSQGSATFYVGGRAVAIQPITEDRTAPEFLEVAGVHLGSEDWSGGIGPISIFDTALDQRVVQARALRGP